MASAMNVVFNKLEKFSGSADLNRWLKFFERYCVVSNKTDDLVQGQLLMLFVDGQAKVVLEELEEVKETPQKFSDSVTKLKEVFHTVGAREGKMADFEVHTQRIAESEDEFMLDLVKLFRYANPTADAGILDVAVKRKFLQGISPSLRREIFVFCNDAYAATVSREQLLQHCRKARVHLVASSHEDKQEILPSSSLNVLEPPSNVTHVVQAIQDLTTQLAQQMTVMSKKLSEQDEKITVLTNNYRGGTRPRPNGSNNFLTPNRVTQRNNAIWRPRFTENSRQFSAREELCCFKCGGQNHLARNCLLRYRPS